MGTLPFRVVIVVIVVTVATIVNSIVSVVERENTWGPGKLDIL